MKPILRLFPHTRLSALISSLLGGTLLAAGSALAVTGDFKNTDFAAAAPYTYNHATGGGAYNDGTNGDYKDVTEQLEGGQFACGDVVTYLAQIAMEANTVEPVQTGRFTFRFLGDSTGQSGAAHSEIVGVRINYGQVENGDNGSGTNPGAGSYGLDSGIRGDGGSTATLVSQRLTGPLFTAGTDLEAVIDVSDLEAGEKVVLRIDTRLACKPGTSPTGNLQGALINGETLPAGETINTGNQTIPFQKVGDIAGAGEPLLKLEKTVTTADGSCGSDDVEELSVYAGDTVKYCYTLSNPGTAGLFNGKIVDDNGTAGNAGDDFTLTAGNLASGATKTFSKLVTLNSAGTVVNIATTTGDNGKTGGQLVTYSVSDTATVQVQATPNQAPVANDDTVSTDDNGSVLISPVGNDTDPDNNLDDSTVTIVSGPAMGTLTQNEDGTFTYEADAGASGQDSFIYQVCDSEGLCDQATVTIDIAPIAHPPVAEKDSASTPEDTAVTVDVAANDTDVDGDLVAASAILVSEPAHGTVVSNGDGTFTYTPDANWFGTDAFSYEICDTTGRCAIAVVEVQVNPVNDTPVAEDDSVTTNEDTGVTFSVAGNDSDVDNNLDTSSAVVTTVPANGTVTKNADGTFTYVPNANFNGTDSFKYQICDTEGLCDTATVDITVNPVNDAPVAADDSASTDEDAPVTIAVTGNDSGGPADEDQTLTLTAVSDPAHGTAEMVDGQVVYTPDPDYNGADSFTYTVCDSGGLCDTATVTVGVAALNDPPVANDDSAVLDEDNSEVISATSNDSDVDGNLDPSSAEIVSYPSHGSLVSNGDGTFTYTPNADYNGADSFSYEVCDTGTPVFCDTATVNLTVNPVNDAPVANNDQYVTTQDTTVTIDRENGVLPNDTDVDGDQLSVGEYDATTQYGGAVTMSADGSFDYTPESGFAGYDSFTYEVCDASGLCDTGTVTVEVQARNNRSISVDLQSFSQIGKDLSGYLVITNQSSGNYGVQITDMTIDVQYRSSEVKQWTSVPVTECTFDPEPEFWIGGSGSQGVSFSGCKLAKDLTGTTVRVTANVKIYGRFMGKKAETGGWFLSRLSY